MNAVGGQFARQFEVEQPEGNAALRQAQGSRAYADWFSLAELAVLALPGLPGDKRSLSRRAKDERWTCRADASGALLSRQRVGRGGGTEFHVGLLPPKRTSHLCLACHVSSP